MVLRNEQNQLCNYYTSYTEVLMERGLNDDLIELIWKFHGIYDTFKTKMYEAHKILCQMKENAYKVMMTPVYSRLIYCFETQNNYGGPGSVDQRFLTEVIVKLIKEKELRLPSHLISRALRIMSDPTETYDNNDRQYSYFSSNRVNPAPLADLVTILYTTGHIDQVINKYEPATLHSMVDLTLNNLDAEKIRVPLLPLRLWDIDRPSQRWYDHLVTNRHAPALDIDEIEYQSDDSSTVSSIQLVQVDQNSIRIEAPTRN